MIENRHRQVAQLETELDNLQEDLRVEDEIVAVPMKWDLLQYLAAIGTKPSVPFTKILTGEDALHERQPAIRKIF